MLWLCAAATCRALLGLWHKSCLADRAHCVHLEPCNDAVFMEHVAAAEVDHCLPRLILAAADGAAVCNRAGEQAAKHMMHGMSADWRRCRLESGTRQGQSRVLVGAITLTYNKCEKDAGNWIVQPTSLRISRSWVRAAVTQPHMQAAPSLMH